MSRYIGAVGMETVTKQTQASILLIGFNVMGVEVAKNIVLSGVQRLSIFDNNHVVEERDVLGHFFLSTGDIGKNRVQAALFKLQ